MPHLIEPSWAASCRHRIDVDLALFEPLSQCPLVLRWSIDEPVLADRSFASGVGRDWLLELGQTVHYSTANTGKVMGCSALRWAR
jgi:hypothetical protein